MGAVDSAVLSGLAAQYARLNSDDIAGLQHSQMF